MSVILAVSPHYLGALLEQSKRFNFKLQGYDNFKSANNGLLKTNISDILGFIIFAERLDVTKELVKFLKRCDILAVKEKHLLFALKDGRNLNKLLKTANLKNLKINYITNYEVVTDVFIKRDIFGTLLRYNYNPYTVDLLNNLPLEIEQPKLESIRIAYQPLLDRDYYNCIADVELMDNIRDTLKADRYLSVLKSRNRTLYELRIKLIHAYFGLEYNIESLNDLECDYCFYKSITHYIESMVIKLNDI